MRERSSQDRVRRMTLQGGTPWTPAVGVRAFLALGVVCLTITFLSAQDEKVEVRFTRVYLHNGNVVEGQLVSRTRTGVTLRIAGGDLTIPDVQVSRVETVAYSERREVPKPPPPSKEKPRGGPASEPAGPQKESPEAVQHKVNAILGSLKSADQQQKYVMAKSLSDLGKEAAPYLASRFESLDFETRGFVFEVLLEHKDPSTIPAVQKLLASKVSSVRAQAVQLLASLGDASQAEPLRGLLADPDGKVRGSAIDALTALEDRESFDSITSLCKDANATTRRKAIAASVQLSRKFQIQERWVHALEGLMDETRGELRADLVCAMGQTGSQNAPRAVMGYLDDQSAEVRAAVVAALADLGAKGEGDNLVRQMNLEKDKWVRLRMTHAAQRLRLEQAVPNLIDWLEDPDAEIRSASRVGLGEITSQNFGEDKAKWTAWWIRSKGK